LSLTSIFNIDRGISVDLGEFFFPLGRPLFLLTMPSNLNDIIKKVKSKLKKHSLKSVRQSNQKKK